MANKISFLLKTKTLAHTHIKVMQTLMNLYANSSTIPSILQISLSETITCFLNQRDGSGQRDLCQIRISNTKFVHIMNNVVYYNTYSYL